MQSSVFRFALAVAVVGCALSRSATAQEAREPEGGALPSYAKVFPVPKDHEAADIPIVRNGLPNIMVTGYWPPTNEMLRRFNPASGQNPWGWVGANWEWRGYNVYAFFPEFPYGLGKGEGDFEVDYQDTSSDWWSVMAAPLEPIAIITTGRADNDYDWELEGGHVMYAIGAWGNDYLAPYQPEGLPLTDHEPGTQYGSSLPMQAIVDAVDAQVPNVNPYYTAYDDSNFLCNFIGYHATWYHAQHTAREDPARNVAAGHIHVGSAMGLLDAVEAIEVTLRTLTGYLDEQLLVPMDFEPDGDVDADDRDVFVSSCFGQPVAPPCDLADADGDDDVDCADWEIFKRTWTDAMNPPALFAACDYDCNGNSVADEFDIALGTSRDCDANLIPDDCDVAECTSCDVNGNGIPDECEAKMPLPEDSLGITCTADSFCWPDGWNEAYCVLVPEGPDPGYCYAPKTRYLSIAAHPAQLSYTALRTSIEGEPGSSWWIGEPEWIEPTDQHDGFWLSGFVSSPVYVEQWPNVFHVTGCEIAPGYTYLVQAILQWQDVGDELSYSEALPLRTNSTWGDVVSTCPGQVCGPPNGIVGLNDILAGLMCFQGVRSAPLTWLDIAPSTGSVEPDGVVNLGDILGCIAGFQEQPYPGHGPWDCP